MDGVTIQAKFQEILIDSDLSHFRVAADRLFSAQWQTERHIASYQATAEKIQPLANWRFFAIFNGQRKIKCAAGVNYCSYLFICPNVAVFVAAFFLAPANLVVVQLLTERKKTERLCLRKIRDEQRRSL